MANRRIIKYKFVDIIILGLLLFVAVGCHRLPLKEPNYGLTMEVNIDVTTRLNDTDTLYNPNLSFESVEPQMFRAIFYDAYTGRMVSDNYISDVTKATSNYTVRGAVNVIPGIYDLLLYNFDTEVINVTDDKNINTITATTQMVSPSLSEYLKSKIKSDPIQEYPIVYEPDMLLVTKNRVNIPYSSQNIELDAIATPIVDMYYLQIRLNGGEFVSDAVAVLSGFASANKIGVDQVCYDDPCSLYFPLVVSKDKDQGVLACYFHTFGRVPSIENVIEISFDITTVDGRIQKEYFKVSDAFAKEEAIKYHWILIDKEITVLAPTPGDGGGSGFDPSVDEWESENHEINL